MKKMGSAKPRDVFYQKDNKRGTTLRKPEPHPRRRDNGVQCWSAHRVTPRELASHFVCPPCLTLFRHTGAIKTSGSEKLHNCSGARMRSLQDHTNNRVLGGRSLGNLRCGPRKNARVPQVWGCPSWCGVRDESCFTSNTWPRTCQRTAGALLSSAGSTHPKPKTRFLPVFCCSGKTRGGVFGEG